MASYTRSDLTIIIAGYTFEKMEYCPIFGSLSDITLYRLPDKANVIKLYLKYRDESENKKEVRDIVLKMK